MDQPREFQNPVRRVLDALRRDSGPVQFEYGDEGSRAPKVRAAVPALDEVRGGFGPMEFEQDARSARMVAEEAMARKQADGDNYRADYVDQRRTGIGRGQINAQPVRVTRGDLTEVRLPSGVPMGQAVETDGLGEIFSRIRAAESGLTAPSAAGRTVEALYAGKPAQGPSDAARREQFLQVIQGGDGLAGLPPVGNAVTARRERLRQAVRGEEGPMMGLSPVDNAAIRAVQGPVMTAIYGGGDQSLLNRPTASAASGSIAGLGAGLAPAGLVGGAESAPMAAMGTGIAPATPIAPSVAPIRRDGQMEIPGIDANLAGIGREIVATPGSETRLQAEDFARGRFADQGGGVSLSGSVDSLANKEKRAIAVAVNPQTMLPDNPENLDRAIEALQKKAINVDMTNAEGYDPAEMRSNQKRSYKNRQMTELPGDVGFLGPWVGKGEPALMYPQEQNIVTGEVIPKYGPSGLEEVDEVTSLKEMAQNIRNETRTPVIGQETYEGMMKSGKMLGWSALNELGMLPDNAGKGRPPVGAIVKQGGAGEVLPDKFVYERVDQYGAPVPGEYRVGSPYGYDTEKQASLMREAMKMAGVPIKVRNVAGKDTKVVNAGALMRMSDNPARFEVRVPGVEEALPPEFLGRLAVEGLSSDVRTRKANLPAQLVVKDNASGVEAALDPVYDASGSRRIGYARDGQEAIVQGPKLLGNASQRIKAEKEMGISGSGIQQLINTLTAAGSDGSMGPPMGSVPAIDVNPELKEASLQLFAGQKPRTTVYFPDQVSADLGLRAVADSTGIPLTKVAETMKYNVPEYGAIKEAPEKARINAAITSGVDQATREGNIIQRIANEARRQGKGNVDLRRVRTGGVPTLTREIGTPLYEQAAIAGLQDMVPGVSMPSSFSPVRRIRRR